MESNFKRWDGFEGEKLISLPEVVWKNMAAKNPVLSQLYITHIGYFPKAENHCRERKNGCEDDILIYCTQGKGHYILADQQFEVTAHQYIIIPATDRYIRYWADEKDPWTIYWIHFSGNNMRQFNQSMNIAANDGPLSIPLNTKGIQLWNDMYQSLEMGFSTENICNANFCLYHFIATFLFNDKHRSDQPDPSSDIITTTILHMQAHLHVKLEAEALAELNGLSVSHFSHVFRKATGMAPIEYFIHMKMQKACQLLFGSELKIKEVAKGVGYEDAYYFSRIFKKYIGVSPEAFRMGT